MAEAAEAGGDASGELVVPQVEKPEFPEVADARWDGTGQTEANKLKLLDMAVPIQGILGGYYLDNRGGREKVISG